MDWHKQAKENVEALKQHGEPMLDGLLTIWPRQDFRFRNRDGDCVDWALGIVTGVHPNEWTNTIMEHSKHGMLLTSGKILDGTNEFVSSDLLKNWIGAEKMNLYGQFRYADPERGWRSGHNHPWEPTMRKLRDSEWLEDGAYVIFSRNHAAALEVRNGEWYVADNNCPEAKPWVRTTTERVDLTGVVRRKHEYPVFGARTRINGVWKVPTTIKVKGDINGQ